MRVLVTGASGFVGQHLLEVLDNRHEAVAAVLDEVERAKVARSAATQIVGDIGTDVDWKPALQGVDAVIHLAARAHILEDRHPDPAGEFDRINHRATALLAASAANEGVKRFVLISTIGVHGDGQGLDYEGTGYAESDTLHPHNAYAASKLHAEQAVQRVSADSGMEFVIVRPPLVYGAGVRGNFYELLKWVARGTPLPFGGIRNRRSMIGVRNLASLLRDCLEKKSAANQVFVVGDGRDLSTPDLFRALGPPLGQSGKLPSLPRPLVQLALTALGKGRAFNQLCGNLVVDTCKSREVLGWEPVCSVEQGLLESAQWFLTQGRA